METHILFIGSPLLDITSKCDQEYLKKYDLKPDDCVRATESHRSLFKELLQKSDALFIAGGTVQNSARVCKWVLAESGSVAFAGYVGKDEFAFKMRDQLIKDNVEPIYAVHPTLPTGLCACLVDEHGERSMVTDHGAASTYNVNNLDAPDVQNSMKKASAIFVAAYFLAHSSDVFEAAANFCSSENKLFSIGLSAPYICRNYADLLTECMPFVDVVFCNSTEAVAFVETITPGTKYKTLKDCARIIAQFQKHNSKRGRVVIVTDGANPVTVCETGGDPCEYPVLKVDNFVDTIGCGDALAGAFLATYLKTKSTSKSIRNGILSAGKIAAMHGCMLPDEKFEETMNEV